MSAEAATVNYYLTVAPSDYVCGVYEAAEDVMSFINSLDESESPKIRAAIYQHLMEIRPAELWRKNKEVVE